MIDNKEFISRLSEMEHVVGKLTKFEREAFKEAQRQYNIYIESLINTKENKTSLENAQLNYLAIHERRKKLQWMSEGIKLCKLVISNNILDIHYSNQLKAIFNTSPDPSQNLSKYFSEIERNLSTEKQNINNKFLAQLLLCLAMIIVGTILVTVSFAVLFACNNGVAYVILFMAGAMLASLGASCHHLTLTAWRHTTEHFAAEPKESTQKKLRPVNLNSTNYPLQLHNEGEVPSTGRIIYIHLENNDKIMFTIKLFDRQHTYELNLEDDTRRQGIKAALKIPPGTMKIELELDCQDAIYKSINKTLFGTTLINDLERWPTPRSDELKARFFQHENKFGAECVQGEITQRAACGN